MPKTVKTGSTYLLIDIPSGLAASGTRDKPKPFELVGHRLNIIWKFGFLPLAEPVIA